MAQSLLTIPVQTFRAEIKKVSSPQILNLIAGLYDLKYTIRDKVSDQQILDLERKETIMQKELQLRGFLGKKDAGDFQKWKHSLFKKKNY